VSAVRSGLRLQCTKVERQHDAQSSRLRHFQIDRLESFLGRFIDMANTESGSVRSGAHDERTDGQTLLHHLGNLVRFQFGFFAPCAHTKRAHYCA
jgi:hypothetical protein